jgi:uncharacterized protein YjbI with pentapeptide repeats
MTTYPTREEIKQIVEEARQKGEQPILRGLSLPISEEPSTPRSWFKRLFSRLSENKFDLSHLDLQGVRFEKCSLTKFNFSQSDLRQTRWYSVGLDKVNFSGADLRGASFEWAHWDVANLNGADLRGVDWNLPKLRNVTMNRATQLDPHWQLTVEIIRHGAIKRNLAGVNLSKMDLSITNLSGADLSEANLQGCYFTEACLRGANLQQADLREARLLKTDLTGVDLRGANLEGAAISTDWVRDMLYDDSTIWPKHFNPQLAIKRSRYEPELPPYNPQYMDKKPYIKPRGQIEPTRKTTATVTHFSHGPYDGDMDANYTYYASVDGRQVAFKAKIHTPWNPEALATQKYNWYKAGYQFEVCYSIASPDRHYFVSKGNPLKFV